MEPHQTPGWNAMKVDGYKGKYSCLGLNISYSSVMPPKIIMFHYCLMDMLHTQKTFS
jgi:hypothetical protein